MNSGPHSQNNKEVVDMNNWAHCQDTKEGVCEQLGTVRIIKKEMM